MTRFDSALNQAEAELASISLAICADLDFVSGHVRVNDSDVYVPIDGNLYSPLGILGTISMVEESTEIIARAITLELSGVDASLIATARDEVYQNRPVAIYMALFNRTTQSLIDAPEVVWEGRMNQMIIVLDGENSQITLSCEHRLRSAPPASRYTNQDQQLRYSGDRFFDLLPQIPGYRGAWGDRLMQGLIGGGISSLQDKNHP